jgi:hypothetical protein
VNLWEFGHSLLTGEFRLQRAMVREAEAFRNATQGKRELMVAGHLHRMRLYAGAEPGINRPMPNQLSTPEDYKQAFERIVLIRAARQMEEDYGFFDGLLDDFETYVVGDYLEWIPNTGNKDANKMIREFLEWKFDEADYTERLDLTKIAHLGIRTMKRDGECGYIPVDVGDSIKLQQVSGDCIGNPMIGANIGPNNYNGIRTNDGGIPVFYDLYRRVPKLNCYYFDRSIEAHHFWHYCDPFRMEQYHGVTAFKTAVRDGFDIDQILEFAKLNIKWRASQLPTMHTETGRPKGTGIGYGFAFPGGPGAPNPNGTPTVNGVPQPMQTMVDGVTVNYMKLDEHVMEYPNDFPNAQLRVTIEELRRQCCKGARLPYEFVYRADNGGVVQRFWADKAQKTFNKDKHWMKRTLLSRFKNRVVQKGIDTGELDLDSFGDLNTNIARFRGQWKMGQTVSVDYGKETDSDIKLMDACLMSPVDFAANSGNGNLDEIMDEVDAFTRAMFEKAKKAAKDLDVPLETILPFYVKKFPNQAPTQGGDPENEKVPAAAETED